MNCDICNKNEATLNFQRCWVVWEINDGNYNTDGLTLLANQNPIGEDNSHLCKDCAKEVNPNWQGQQFKKV